MVPAPFDELPDGASPLALPVEVPDKAALLQRLAERGVMGIDFCPTPHANVPRERAATATHRRQHTVVLPVHQGLSIADLNRIAEAVRPSPRRHEYLYAERIDDLDAVRAEWTTLAFRTRNIFATWEWHRTWWDHFGNGRRLEATATGAERCGRVGGDDEDLASKVAQGAAPRRTPPEERP